MKDNWFTLPPDTNKWQSIIIENLSKIAPEIPQYIAGFEMNQFDPILGDGDGLIYLLNGIAAIPVTIRQFRLAPMDTMVTKNEDFYPVSSYFLQKAYADNVIAAPVNDETGSTDNVEEGPARRIRTYQTVDQVKRASEEVRTHLRSEMEKSAKVMTFFNKHMPDVLEALYEVREEVPNMKLASSNLPEIHFLAKDGDNYYFNGESVSLDEASEFAKIAGFSEDDRLNLLHGGCVCLDYRAKHASLSIGLGGSLHPKDASTDTCMATVVDLNGIPHKGFFHRRTIYNQAPSPQISSNGSDSRHIECVFVTDTFYSIQDDMMLVDAVPLKPSDLVAVSVPTDPVIGSFGVVIGEHEVNGPFEVCSVSKHGNITVVRVLDHGMNHQEFTIDDKTKFYETPENRREVMKHPDAISSVSPGTNCSVGLSGDGQIVYGGKSYSYANAVYSLMESRGLSFDDALRVSDLAKTAGTVSFKIAADEEKKPEKKDESKDSGSDGKEQKQDGPPKKEEGGEGKEEAQEGQEGKEEQKDGFSQFAVNDGGAQGPQGPADPNAQPAQDPNNPNNPNQPVTSGDLEDISALNDPSMMDSYLSGQLADVNTAGRDQIMQIADDLFESTKSLGKLLYLIRLGKIDYVKEADAMLAFNKLSDVTKNLGMSSSQMF